MRDITTELMEHHRKQPEVSSVYSDAAEKIQYLRSLLQKVYNIDADFWPESIKDLVETEARRA